MKFLVWKFQTNVSNWWLRYLLWNCPQVIDLTDDMSTLVQVMAWCRQSWCCQATSHYLSQCWPRSMSPYGVTRPQWLNTVYNYTMFHKAWQGQMQLECAASNGNRWLPPSFAPTLTLEKNAQPPENAVNEQTDRWTDRQTNNNIHKHPWMLSVSHLDTSACQIVGHFFQALCMQYTNPSPWMVGRTDERMKWQQYPLASMLAKGKSSENICISNSMPFLPSDLSANVQKPENVVNRPIDGQTDGQTDGQKSGRGALLLGGIAVAPSTWFRRKMW